MQNYYRARGLTGNSLSIPTGRGNAVYILPTLDPTLALLLVGFTKYDDDDDLYNIIYLYLFNICQVDRSNG
ncbi:hypothetical protein Hanom_Chr04g00338331 [Helianthus anomalus]